MTSSMSYRRLGTSGLAVSTVGLGCNAFGVTIAPDDVPDVVSAAIDAGITLFDTADIYGSSPGESETLLGAALAGRRDDVVVATKFGGDMRGAYGRDGGARGSRRYLRRAVEGSLRRLGTDRIDLYQMHMPDWGTPLEETLAALHELVLEGKVLYLGSSNFASWQIVDADWIARTGATTPFVSVQDSWSLLDRRVEKEVLPATERVGAGFLPYLPLASGLLTGKYRRGQEPAPGTRLAMRPDRYRAADFDRIEALEALAGEWGVDLLTLAMGWLAAQPAVGSVIAGASRAEQVRVNVAAAAWEPTLEQLAAIDAASPAPA
jgi:aryl-alcohol dehydrogenase-like predicted oxidoreductase